MELDRSGDLILVRMDDGEDVFVNLNAIAEKYSLKSAVIVCALGMLKNVELAYFKYPEKAGEYICEKFNGPFEIVGFKGSFALSGNKPFWHIHAALASDKFNCLGGHLNKAIVNATLEMFLQVPEKKFVRKLDEKTGLNILHFE